eukprot:gb/GECG01003943.1/.p1 GENE.gb/GECG01003943.1/~~gb/GECG01003943.1/.p1  ORF type:complete len:155 (+),score=17.54 gb/GECG01003943.1/:1-465(+)
MKTKHKKAIKMAKGFRGRSKNVYSIAMNRVEKSLKHARVGRKQKKRDMRQLWIQRMNAGCRQHGLRYNQFVRGLQVSDIELNRKILADLAVTEPYSFKAVVEAVKATGLKIMQAAQPAQGKSKDIDTRTDRYKRLAQVVSKEQAAKEDAYSTER